MKDNMQRKVKLIAPTDAITPKELREWRRARGWTQPQAAKHLGVSVRSIENWEQGIRDMRHPVAMRKLMAQARMRREE